MGIQYLIDPYLGIGRTIRTLCAIVRVLFLGGSARTRARRAVAAMDFSGSRRIVFGMLTLVAVAAGPAQADDPAGFQSVSGSCRFSFPADHGPHPGFRTEWWYYTGNLTATTGERFGFQLTFFRRQLRPAAARREWPAPASAWRTNQIYLAHAALTDLTGQRHVMTEKVSREGLGMAGVAMDEKGTRIFLHTWEAVITPAAHKLRMVDRDFNLELRLVPTHGPVAHGQDGYSRKGSSPEQASCYYSFPRMVATGRVQIGDRDYPVQGLGWMDHEFSSAPLAEGVTGWDWFSIQLGNQRELMMYLLRLESGGFHPASSGTLIGPGGQVKHLTQADFRAQVTRRWTSPQTGATYPLGWAISLPAHGMELELTAALDDQEMITTGSTGVTYWEGSLSVSGQTDGLPVTGQGYMELTGYADPYAPPL